MLQMCALREVCKQGGADVCRGPARSRGRGASNRPSSMHVDDFERQKAGGGGPPGAMASAVSLQSPHSHGCTQFISLLRTAHRGRRETCMPQCTAACSCTAR